MNQRTQERLKVGDEVKLSHVPLDEVPYVWQSQLDMIEKAMTKGQGDWATSGELLEDVYDQRSQLWALHRDEEILGVIVTTVRANQLMTKVFIQLLAGSSMSEWDWLENQETFLKFADYIGADCIEASCRSGLAKFLKHKGWSQKAVIMELKR